MTSTYDHRIIQGAESGRFLERIEELPAGRGRLLRGASSSSLGVELGPAPQAPQPRCELAAAAPAARRPTPAPRPSTRSCCRRCRPRPSLAQGPPHARPPRRASSTRSAPSPSGDPALDPEPLGLTPELMRQIPAQILRIYVAGRDARRRAAAPARDLLRHDRLRDRAHRLAPPARVAARADRVGRVPPRRSTAEEQARLLRRLIEVDALERFMHKAYLGQKQFSIEGLDMTVPMLDELIQLSAGAGGARGRDRHGPPRPAQRARAQPRPRLRHDLRRVRGRLRRSRRSPTIPQGGTGDVKYHHGASGTYELRSGEHDPRQPGVEPEPPRVRRPGRRGRHARRADRAREGPHADAGHRTPPCRSSSTATPPSPARASSRRR